MGAAKLQSERLKVGLGDQGVAVVVGPAHALGHGRGQRSRQPVGDIAELSGEGLARWRLLRFQPLPIQPCVKFSLTRLTDTVHRVACADAYRTVPASR